jgi:lipoprotein NlpD
MTASAGAASAATSAASAPAAAVVAPAVTATPASAANEVNWAWPAPGTVVASFDEQRNNNGLAIGGKAGEPVLAAADGTVMYAGSGIRGYGNMIVIKHNDTFLSAYAHNQVLLVKEDQVVRRGQQIAQMGNTESDAVKLHFEIRRKGKPVDPARLLPPR